MLLTILFAHRRSRKRQKLPQQQQLRLRKRERKRLWTTGRRWMSRLSNCLAHNLLRKRYAKH